MFQRLKEALGLDPIKNQTDAYIKRVAEINKLENIHNTKTKDTLLY